MSKEVKKYVFRQVHEDGKYDEEFVLASEYDALTLIWRKEKPKDAGWYWWRNIGRVSPYILRLDEDGLVLFTDGYETPEELGGEWAGPLPEPVEQQAT